LFVTANILYATLNWGCGALPSIISSHAVRRCINAMVAAAVSVCREFVINVVTTRHSLSVESFVTSRLRRLMEASNRSNCRPKMETAPLLQNSETAQSWRHLVNSVVKHAIHANNDGGILSGVA